MKTQNIMLVLLAILATFLVNAANAQVNNLGNSTAVFGWFKLGTLTLPQGGADAQITIVSGNGYNAAAVQQGECVVHFRTSNGDSQAGGFYGSGTYYNTGRTKLIRGLRVVQTNINTWDFYAELPPYTGDGAILNLVSSLGTWTPSFVQAGLPNSVAYSDLTEELCVQSPAVFAGNVGVGVLDTRGYKLAINGSAIAESVTVKLQSNWPDYVFKPDYLNKTLPEIESYISEHKHLPDLPTASEVREKGIDLGEMNVKLLQKIEEMTLLLIEQNKRIQKLESERKQK
jgi:hypothetical protein